MQVCLQKLQQKVRTKAHSICHSVYTASPESAGPECLKTTSTVLLENNGENWKHQVLPSSVLRGKIKLWFKHQPKLDSFRHMVFTTPHIGEHI